MRGGAARWRVDSGLWLAAELCYLLTRFFEQTKVVLGTSEFASVVSSVNPEGEGERPGGQQHQCIQASLMTLKMPPPP